MSDTLDHLLVELNYLEEVIKQQSLSNNYKVNC